MAPGLRQGMKDGIVGGGRSSGGAAVFAGESAEVIFEGELVFETGRGVGVAG